MNSLKTTLLFAGLTGLLMLIGELAGGTSGAVMMFFVAAVMNLGTWFFSDTLVLRTSGAVPVGDDPRLRWLDEDVAELAKKAGIPKPGVYWVPNEHSPNAFATGRSPSRGVVAVTAGLLNTLDRRQIRGVLAHELGHIKNRDTLVSAIAGTMAGAISMAARWILWTRDRDTPVYLALAVYLLAPMAALLLRMMVSRTREYGADARAAELTGDPEGLASALQAISRGVSRQPQTQGNPSTHYIVNGFAGGLSNWFSTHPPVEERIRRLMML